MGMGPPEKAPFVRIEGKGISVLIRPESKLDQEIILLALQISERRRYGKTK